MGRDSTMLLLSLQTGLAVIEESMKEKNSPPDPLTQAHDDPFVGPFKHIQMEKKSVESIVTAEQRYFFWQANQQDSP
jgi:hypothetical protein